MSDNIVNEVLIPKSPFKIKSTITEIKNFAESKELDIEERLMILVPLEKDYRSVPTEVNSMLADFILIVIETLQAGIEDEQL